MIQHGGLSQALGYVLCALSILGSSCASQESTSNSQLRHRMLPSDGESSTSVWKQVTEPCNLGYEVSTSTDGTETGTWKCQLQGVDGVSYLNLVEADAEDGSSRTILGEVIDATWAGRITIFVNGMVFDNSTIVLPAGVNPDDLEYGRPSLLPTESNADGNNRRALMEETSKGTDVRTVLIVIVGATYSNETLITEATIKEEVFGIGGVDEINLSERFKTCSYGKVEMVPFNGTIDSIVIAEGVVNLTVPDSLLNQNWDTARTKVTDAFEASYSGFNSFYSTYVDHVMFAMPDKPDGDGDWQVATASLPGVYSWYNGDSILGPANQVHELGHNLGLWHANEDVEGDSIADIEFADRTGLMSFSFPEDEINMCYNTPHSYQLNWYHKKTIELDFTKRGPFTGTLVGVNDYENPNADDAHVIVKIKAGDTQYYLGFNGATGMNSGVLEKRNHVVLYEQKGGGHTRSLGSWDKDGIHRRYNEESSQTTATFTITDYMQTGKDLKISVPAVRPDLELPQATILIELGDCSIEDGPGNEKCFGCNTKDDCTEGAECAMPSCMSDGVCIYDTSGCAAGSFELEVTFDRYADEFGASLIDHCNGNQEVINIPYRSFNNSYQGETYKHEETLTYGQYTFAFWDKFGDGLSVSYKGVPGNVKATLNDQVLIELGGKDQWEHKYIRFNSFGELPNGGVNYCPGTQGVQVARVQGADESDDDADILWDIKPSADGQTVSYKINSPYEGYVNSVYTDFQAAIEPGFSEKRCLAISVEDRISCTHDAPEMTASCNIGGVAVIQVYFILKDEEQTIFPGGAEIEKCCHATPEEENMRIAQYSFIVKCNCPGSTS